MANTLLSVQAITEECLKVLANNLRFHPMFTAGMQVWDGEKYFDCREFISQDDTDIHYVCGCCGQSDLKTAGDVCATCFSIAVARDTFAESGPKIGDTINIRRPGSFRPQWTGPARNEEPADFSYLKF